jgi:hypothetical protein
MLFLAKNFYEKLTEILTHLQKILETECMQLEQISCNTFKTNGLKKLNKRRLIRYENSCSYFVL